MSALTHPSDFLALRSVACSRCCDLRITARSRPLSEGVDSATLKGLRLGISTPRRMGPAVVRNRVRRQIREALRVQLRDLPDGIDLVVVVNRTPNCSFVQLCSCLRRSIDRSLRQTETTRYEVIDG